jgi:hypothetical protein
MKRLALSATLSVLAALVLVLPASAGISWCRTDPHLAIGGRTTHIYFERDAALPNASTGPIQLVVTVAPGVSTAVLDQDLGFGFGYVISFVESASLDQPDDHHNIRIAAFVPGLDAAMPVRLVSEPTDTRFPSKTRQGTTNAWITMNTHV